MNQVDEQYLALAKRVLAEGADKSNRTDMDARSIFGAQMRFDLREGFPLLTTKRVFLKGVIHELLWILSGETNIEYLQNNGVHIWDQWSDENGDLGPVYGAQWRRWVDGEGFLDQISEVVDSLTSDPMSRRHIVTAWNPAEIPQMALAPCHCFFQFNAEPIPAALRMLNSGRKYYLDCQLYQRSADLFLGVPFNIASYALLTMMMAKVTGMVPRHFVHTFGDVHIYHNHIEQMMIQAGREGRMLPTMLIGGNQQTLDDFRYEDFELVGYNPHPVLKGAVAV